MAQPGEWQDCSDALDRDDLKGVVMPKGGLKQLKPPGAWLQYNEVSSFVHKTSSNMLISHL